MRLSSVSYINSDGCVRFSDITTEHLGAIQSDKYLKDKVKEYDERLWEVAPGDVSVEKIDVVMFRLFEHGFLFYEDFKQFESPAEYMRKAQKDGRFPNSFVSISARKYLFLNLLTGEKLPLTYA